MDNQNIPTFCPNLPLQGSEKLSFDSTIPRKQVENYIFSDLSSLNPLSQGAFLFETYKPASVKYSNSEMFYAERAGKPNSVGVAVATVTPCTEDCNLGDVKGTSFYPNVFESQATFSKLASVNGNLDSVANMEDFGVLHPEKMKLEPSASCQKRFILFDQSGSTGRIIYHPSQFSMLSPAPAKPMKEINAQSMARKEVPCCPLVGNLMDCDTGCPAYKETVVAAAFAALQKIRADRLNTISLGNVGDEFIPATVEEWEENTSRPSDDGKPHSELHENTEDLDALLSSDSEECSTGHSPSEISGNNGDAYEDDIPHATSALLVKRRRIDTREYGEEEDDCISASVKEPLDKSILDGKCLSPDLSVVETSSWEPAAQPEHSENVKDENNPAHSSYSVSDGCSSRSSGNERVRSLKCLSGPSRSSKKSKKEKIKRTVKLLRSIIPGGNGMDTAVVLNEAIQYVKLLQMKVKKLEVNQRDMMMK